MNLTFALITYMSYIQAAVLEKNFGDLKSQQVKYLMIEC